MKVWVLMVLACSFCATGVNAQESRTRFYDFSETVITSELKVPGLSLILGDEFAPSDCPQIDADAFRRCIGEVQDVFRYVPPGRRIPMDIALVPIGRDALKIIGAGIGDGIRSFEGSSFLPRIFLVPHPESMPGAHTRFRRIPRYYEWRRATRGNVVRGIEVVTRGMADLAGLPPGLIALQALLDERGSGHSPLRKNGMLAVVVVATEPDAWGRIATVREELDRVYGPSGWSITVYCAKAACDGLAPLAHHVSHDVMPIGEYSFTDVAKRTAEDVNWRVNRWTLSHNPAVYGSIEIRSDGRVLDTAYFAYDPFERRMRVSDIRIPIAEGSKIEAWYFPFDPVQGLLSVCPEGAKARGPGEGGDGSAANPCKDWVADEVVGPKPAQRIDVFFFSGRDKAPRKRIRKEVFESMIRAFGEPFVRSGVDLRVMDGRKPHWRKGAFRVVISPQSSPKHHIRCDAPLLWEDVWSDSALKSLGWRVLNRSIGITLKGMPILYETLRVFLNGRKIEAATEDGAGYLLRSGRLYLDVAAPLHPDSHIFVTYKRGE